MVQSTLAVLFLLLSAPPPRAVVISLQPEQPLSLASYSAIEAKLSVKGYSGIDPVDAARVSMATDSLNHLQQEPQALFFEAKKSYKNFDDGKARSKLVQAQQVLFESPRILTEKVLLADIHLLQGQMALNNGQRPNALAEFALAELLEPRSLHPGIYPPDVILAYQEARKELSSRPKGALVVESLPAKAQVYVDGSFAGPSPLVLETLVEGTHYVTASVQGRGTRTRRVQVTSGRSTHILLFVPDNQGQVSVQTLLRSYRENPVDSKVAAALMDAVGASLVLALGPLGGACASKVDNSGVVTLALGDEKFQKADSTTRADLLLSGIAKLVQKRRSSVSQPAGQNSGNGGNAGQEEESFPPWAWAAVGGGAVVAIVGAVVTSVVIYNSLQPQEPEDRVDIVLGGGSTL